MELLGGWMDGWLGGGWGRWGFCFLLLGLESELFEFSRQVLFR